MWEVLLPERAPGPTGKQRQRWAVVLRAQLCQPFLLVAEPQHLAGPQTGALIPVGEEPGSQEAEMERASRDIQRSARFFGTLPLREEGRWMCGGVRGGWGCQGRSCSPHLQAWLPCLAEMSQASGHRAQSGLGWKRPPCSWAPGMPCPTRQGWDPSAYHRSRPRGKVLGRAQQWQDQDKRQGRSSTSRKQQQHRVSPRVPPAHAHHVHWLCWGRAGRDMHPSIAPQTDMHAAVGWQPQTGLTEHRASGCAWSTCRESLEQQGRRGTLGDSARCRGCLGLAQLLLGLCGLGFAFVKHNPNFPPPVFPAHCG